MKKKLLTIFIMVMMCIVAFPSMAVSAQADQNLAKIGNTEYATLTEALTASTSMTGDVTITLLDDMTLSDFKCIEMHNSLLSSLTIDGSNKTIDQLREPLVKNMATRPMVVKNLNFTNINLVGNSTNVSSGLTGAGVVTAAIGTSGKVDIDNVTISGGTIVSDDFAGGLFGYCSNGSIVNISDVSISGVTMISSTGGAMGALVGHCSGTLIADDIVIGENIFKPEEGGAYREDKTGILFGTINGGGDVYVDATITANAKVNTTAHTKLLGRISNDAHLNITGGTYLSDITFGTATDTDSNVKINPLDAGDDLKDNVVVDGEWAQKDGKYVVYKAQAGEDKYQTLQEAINNALSTNPIVLLGNVKENVSLIGVAELQLGDKKLISDITATAEDKLTISGTNAQNNITLPALAAKAEHSFAWQDQDTKVSLQKNNDGKFVVPTTSTAATYIAVWIPKPLFVPTTSLQAQTCTYDGEAQAFVTESADGLSVAYKQGDATVENPTFAGVYDVVISRAESENYASYSYKIVGGLVVEKADYDMTGISFNNGSFVYDGNPHSLTVAGTLPTGHDGIQVIVSYSGSAINVADGEVTVTATFATTSENYNAPTSMTAKVSITPKTVSNARVEFEETQVDFAYTGSAIKPGVKVFDGNVLISADEYVVKYANNIEIGNATILVENIANGNYSINQTKTFAITKRQLAKPSGDSSSFAYNGNAQTYEIGIPVLDYQDIYVISNATQTNVGTYDVVVSLGDKTHFEWTDGTTADVTFKFVIAKAQIAKPTADKTAFVYNGKAQTYTVAQNSAYAVSNNTRTNAGSQTVTVALIDKVNCEWADKTTADVTYNFVIAKANYDMSDITFADKSFVYDGEAHDIAIDGTLPSGVTVSYTNNGKTQLGKYTVVASFVGDTANYNPIDDMTAVLSINKQQLVGPAGDSNKPSIIIDAQGGFADGVSVVFKELDANKVQTGDGVKSNEVVVSAYEISLKDQGVSVQPNGMITIKVLLPQALDGKTFKLVHNHNGSFSNVQYKIDNGYVVFSVDKLSEFLFVCDNMLDLGWLIWTLIGIVFLGVVVSILLVLVLKSKQEKIKNNNVKLSSIAPVLLMAGLVPTSVLIALIALGAVAVGLLVFIVAICIKIKKANKKLASIEKAKQKTAPKVDVAKQAQQIEIAKEVVATVSALEEETKPQRNPKKEEGKQSIKIVKEKASQTNEIFANYNRSFMSKLIQSDDDTKQFYCDVKNYLLSHKGVKERLSWKATTFNVGRKAICKFTIRGKTLNVFFALNPADYVDAKFKTIDKSDSKTYEAVPLCYKVKSNRGVNNAKKLVDDVAKIFSLSVIENMSPCCVADYPYQDTQTLVDNGLIKVKGLDGKVITDIDNVVSKPFALHDSVTASQAHEELSDEVAMSLLVAGSGQKTIGKKFAVNIDVLSNAFVSGDVVDINTLKQKGIAPKSAKAIKILARGTLDKMLTVVADSYSADAVKMILLVGGTAKLK